MLSQMLKFLGPHVFNSQIFGLQGPLKVPKCIPLYLRSMMIRFHKKHIKKHVKPGSPPEEFDRFHLFHAILAAPSDWVHLFVALSTPHAHPGGVPRPPSLVFTG